MSAPSRWVFALAIAARRGPINDRLDAATHPAGGFRLCRPDRLQRLHNEPDVNSLYRERTENWKGIASQRGRPLRCVLGIFPPRLVSLDIGFGTLTERHACRRFEHLLSTLGPAVLYRVAALPDAAPGIGRQLARLGQRHIIIAGGAETHVVRFVIAAPSKDPALRTGGRHVQIESAAIGNEPRLGDRRHRARCQFLPKSLHLLSLVILLPNSVSMSLPMS